MRGLLIAFTAGIVLWGGFNWSMELTNTQSFCISCHEMRDNVFREYKETVHFSNASGVRATCPDCHVPKEWVHKLVRKVGATNELYHKWRGSIDTREKFTAKRLDLAKIVWATMEATDSRECRNCHLFRFMKQKDQGKRARQRHSESEREGRTCINCHKGIAHKLPEEFIEEEHERYEREKVDCRDCHEGMARAAPDDAWGDDP